MNDTFMKEKPIFPLLTSMALPMVVSMLVNALYNIVDSLFVARISEEAMTALSLVYPVQNLINAIAIGFSIGIAALISLHLGAGNKEKADMAATHGMVLSLIHGVVISIVCTAIMPRFLRSFTSDDRHYSTPLRMQRLQGTREFRICVICRSHNEQSTAQADDRHAQHADVDIAGKSCIVFICCASV